GLPGKNSVVPWPWLPSALPQEPITSPPQAPSVTPLPSPPQAEPAPPSSPPQEQPTTTSTFDMTLLNTLLETYTTLSHKVVALEQDKVAQALEILKLKRRVKTLEKKRRSKYSGLKRLRKFGGRGIKEIDADEEITLVDMEIQDDLGAALQGKLEEKDKVNAAEPTVFDDEEVAMTMAQTLIKMKAEKARLSDEQMAKRLHNEEVEQAAVREKQEQDDFKRAQELQQQYDQKQENIDWNVVVEQMQEKHLENIRKYQSLKRKPIFVAQARKNMIVYLKNMAGMVKERFSTAVPKVDKDKTLWVELKRLFELDVNDVILKLQRYMHYLIMWKLHLNCGGHQVSSTTRRHDMYMLAEKDYPFLSGVMTLMLSTRLQVEEDSEMFKIDAVRQNDTAAEKTEGITLSFLCC
nr:hypothetical protein [Tanacetum cinerariifolium]